MPAAEAEPRPVYGSLIMEFGGLDALKEGMLQRLDEARSAWEAKPDPSDLRNRLRAILALLEVARHG